MPVLNNAPVSDAYTPAATIQFAYNSRGGWFVVGDVAGVIVQLQYQQGGGRAGRGNEEWAIDETQLGPGATGTIPSNAIGVRFKNQTPGEAATVTAFIGTGEDPVLTIDSFGGATAPGLTILGQGQTTGTSGTATQMTASSIPAAAVVVRAHPANAGLVYIGTAAVTSANGYELAANDAVGLDISNPNEVWFTVGTTGDGISWLAIG